MYETNIKVSVGQFNFLNLCVSLITNLTIKKGTSVRRFSLDPLAHETHLVLLLHLWSYLMWQFDTKPMQYFSLNNRAQSLFHSASWSMSKKFATRWNFTDMFVSQRLASLLNVSSKKHFVFNSLQIVQCFEPRLTLHWVQRRLDKQMVSIFWTHHLNIKDVCYLCVYVSVFRCMFCTLIATNSPQ